MKPITSKYLEILITISLYFIRSHYLPTSKVEPEFTQGNIKTQVSSLECLSNLIWELVKLVRESGHGFGNFITDLLSRCKVQKAIVHCLAATTKSNGNSPRTFRASSDNSRTSGDNSKNSTDNSRISTDNSRTSTDNIRTSTDNSRTSTENSRTSTDNSRTSTDNIRFATDNTAYPKSSSGRHSDASRSFHGGSRTLSEETVDHMILQSKLLEVVESLVVLEHALLSCFEALTPDHHGDRDFEMIMKGDEDGGIGAGASRTGTNPSWFIQGKSLSSQEMLLNMVIYSLKAQGNVEMKSRWSGFVIDCLPYLGGDLKKWVVPVVLQMCANLADVAMLFEEMNSKKDTEKNDK